MTLTTVFSPFFNVAECSEVQERLDRSLTAESRKRAACQSDIAYGNITVLITYFICSE